MKRIVPTIGILLALLVLAEHARSQELFDRGATDAGRSGSSELVPDMRKLGVFIPATLDPGSWSKYLLRPSSANSTVVDELFIGVDRCEKTETSAQSCWLDVVVKDSDDKITNWLRYEIATDKKKITALEVSKDGCDYKSINIEKLGAFPEVAIKNAPVKKQNLPGHLMVGKQRYDVDWHVVVIDNTQMLVAVNDTVKPIKIVKAIAPLHSLMLVDSGLRWQSISQNFRSVMGCFQP